LVQKSAKIVIVTYIVRGLQLPNCAELS